MDYSVLVNYYKQLEGISAKLEKTHILAKLFKEAPFNELDKVVLLVQGTVFPKFTGYELGIATQMMIRAISKATGISTDKVEKEFAKVGDLGLVAEKCVKEKKQAILLTKKLTLEKVFKNLQELAFVTGVGSQERKLNLITELLVSAKPEEACYIVRTILGELRVGVAEGLIRDAIVEAFLIKERVKKEEKEKMTELVDYAWNILSDFGEIAKIAREKGASGLKKVKIQVGRPIQVMLGLAVPSIEEIVKKFGKIIAQYKYDGARVQCLPAGSFVLSNPEIKPIEELRVNDSILSSKGTFKKITHTFKRFYEGELIFLKPANLLGTYLTPEHPVLIVKRIEPYNTGKNYSRPYCKRITCRKYWINYKPEWVKAEDIKVGDFVCFPLFKENKDLDCIDLIEFASKDLLNKQTTKISNKYLITNEKKVKRIVKVDKNFLELIGLYITKGSSNSKWGNISITLGAKEEKEALRIKELFESVFSLQSAVRKRGNWIVYCRSRFVASFLEIFGKRAHTKQIPNFLMLLPPNKLKHLIQSLIKGDGHISKNKIIIKSSSLKLLMQVQLLLTKFGIFSLISKAEDEKTKKIKGKSVKIKKTFQLVIKRDARIKKLGMRATPKRFNQMWFEDLNGFWIPVRKVIRASFKGYVYNLETESNDFCVPFIVHNCHKKGDKIWIFTRRLENVTSQFPDIVELARKGLKAEECIVEGEALGIDKKTGYPLPFQVLSQRIHRKYDIEKMIEEIPVQVNLFDIVYLDGKMLLNKPLIEREKILKKVLGEIPGKFQFAKEIITNDLKKLEEFYHEALNAKQEGLMLKVPNSRYIFGRHVETMYKIKPTMETLDLVIVGANWGEGARAKWLTSYMLACRDPDTGKLLECGMVSTGLTEEQFAAMTQKLKSLIIKEEGKTVFVKPKIIVEVGYQEIQKSPNYTSGYALRFPRWIRERPEKEEPDTIDRLVELFKSQGKIG